MIKGEQYTPTGKWECENKLVLTGKMTAILARFIEDTQNMDMHIDAAKKLTNFILDSQSDDAQRILDLLRWLHDLEDVFRSIRSELSYLE